MAKKGQIQRKYSPEFKISVIMDMREHHLSYNETVNKYELGNAQFGGARAMIQRWERIYLEEGAEGLMKERRGRGKACQEKVIAWTMGLWKTFSAGLKSKCFTVKNLKALTLSLMN